MHNIFHCHAWFQVDEDPNMHYYYFLFIIIIVYLSSIQLTNGPYHESYWPAFQSLDWGDSEGLHVSRGIT